MKVSRNYTMMDLPSINKLNHGINPKSTAEQASFDEHVLMSMWGATGVVIIWEGSKIIQSVSPNEAYNDWTRENVKTFSEGWMKIRLKR